MAKAAQKRKPKGGVKPPAFAKPFGKKPSNSWNKLLTLVPAPKKPKPKLVKKSSSVVPPLTDEQVGAIPGLLSEEEIERRVGTLSTADKSRFTTIRRLLANALGSHAAARAWLVTPGGGFDGCPLDAIRAGLADRVLEVLKAQFSQSPPYA